MSLDQLDLGILAVVGIYMAAYLILIVRRLNAASREGEGTGADPYEGWGR